MDEEEFIQFNFRTTKKPNWCCPECGERNVIKIDGMSAYACGYSRGWIKDMECNKKSQT